MRRGGERFPVLIFEAPLVDARGRRSGWMSTVLDVSAQRRIENSRQQQGKTAGRRPAGDDGRDMQAQPSSTSRWRRSPGYATGSLNLMPATEDDEPAADLERSMIRRQAMVRMAELPGSAPVGSSKPCTSSCAGAKRLQARTRTTELIVWCCRWCAWPRGGSHTRIEVDIPEPPPTGVVRPTMVEQVLLNPRNGHPRRWRTRRRHRRWA